MSAAPQWSFVVTDLSGVVLGEAIRADERKVMVEVGSVPTCSFRLPIWDGLAGSLMDTDTLIKVYRTDAWSGRHLVFHGPTLSAEENADNNSQTVLVNAVGPLWRLVKRIIPGTDAATGWGLGTSASPISLASIGSSILTSVNGVSGGYTGIVAGSQGGTASGYVHYDQPKMAAEALTDLSAGLNSFEIEVVPQEPGGAGAWPDIATMNFPTIIGGVNRPDAIYEFGTTRANVSSYRRQVDRSGIANKVEIPPTDWPNSLSSIVTSSDATSITARGLFEDILSNDGVVSADLLQKLGDNHVAIRKIPRQLITFLPVVNARPMPYVDYSLGDFVRCRAVVRGLVRFDAFFRVWSITYNVDKAGNELIELGLQIS